MVDEKKEIIIIDDEEDYLTVMKAILEKEGYSVLTASSGRELVQHMMKKEPNLLIVDLMMPRVPGEVVIEALEKVGLIGRTPVVVVSAKLENDIKEAAKSIGAKSWLRKPFKHDELIRLVKEIIR